MSPLIPAIVGALVKGAIEHKPSTAAGVATIASALAVPSVTGDGVVIPATLEEGIIQLVMAGIGLFLVWYRGRKKA